MSKTIVLITGANSGIGFELAAQLMTRESYHILVGARSPEKGNAAVKNLQSKNLPGTAEFIEIDVTNDDTINRAVSTIEKQYNKLDILINNAGTSGQTDPQNPSLRQQMRDSFDTNATGTAVLTEALEHLLKNSPGPARIVNISSGAGSINRRLDPNSAAKNIREVQYRASKAALNMVTACQHFDYSPFGIKVFAFCPGFTVSNFSDFNKAEKGAKPAAEAVRPIVEILDGKRDGEAGTFLHSEGVYPW